MMRSCALNSNWNVCFSMMMMSSCGANSMMMMMKRRTCACHGQRNCCCCDLYRVAPYPLMRRKNCCRYRCHYHCHHHHHRCCCCSCDDDQTTTTMMRRTCACCCCYCRPYPDGLTTMMSCDASYFPRDPYLDVYPCHSMMRSCYFCVYPYRCKVEIESTSEYKRLMTKDRVRVGHTDYYCYCCFYVLWMSWSCFCGRCCAPYHDACPCWTIYVCCCCCHFCCYDGDHDHVHWWSHHSIALRRSCFRHFARVDSVRKFRVKNTNVS